jgi:hypothetical protein
MGCQVLFGNVLAYITPNFRARQRLSWAHPEVFGNRSRPATTLTTKTPGVTAVVAAVPLKFVVLGALGDLGGRCRLAVTFL